MVLKGRKPDDYLKAVSKYLWGANTFFSKTCFNRSKRLAGGHSGPACSLRYAT